MIRHVAVVPSTPLVLPDWPARRHPEIAEAARAATRAVAGIGAADVVVVLAGAAELAVHGDLTESAALDLARYGAQLPAHRLGAAPPTTIQALTAVQMATMCTSPPMAGQAHNGGPAGEGAGLPADLAVLCRLLPAGTPTVGVGIPAVTDPATATAVADAILELADDHDVAVLAAGDLGGGHGPKPPRPGAAAASAMFDDLVVAALDNGRPRDLVRLDPDLAAASASRAAGALRVLGHVLDRSQVASVVRTSRAPLGVGYVVAQGG